jgi:hypothetical protein
MQSHQISPKHGTRRRAHKELNLCTTQDKVVCTTQCHEEVLQVAEPLYTTHYLPKKQHTNQHLQPHGSQAPAINTTQVSINQNTQIKLEKKNPNAQYQMLSLAAKHQTTKKPTITASKLQTLSLFHQWMNAMAGRGRGGGFRGRGRGMLQSLRVLKEKGQANAMVKRNV